MRFLFPDDSSLCQLTKTNQNMDCLGNEEGLVVCVCLSGLNFIRNVNFTASLLTEQASQGKNLLKTGVRKQEGKNRYCAGLLNQ